MQIAATSASDGEVYVEGRVSAHVNHCLTRKYYIAGTSCRDSMFDPSCYKFFANHICLLPARPIRVDFFPVLY